MMRRGFRLLCPATPVVAATAAAGEALVTVTSESALPRSLIRRRRKVTSWFSAAGYDLVHAHKLLVDDPLLKFLSPAAVSGNSSPATTSGGSKKVEEKKGESVATPRPIGATIITYPLNLEDSPAAVGTTTTTTKTGDGAPHLQAKNRLKGSVQGIHSKSSSSSGASGNDTAGQKHSYHNQPRTVDVLYVSTPLYSATAAGGSPTFVVFADGGLVGWDSTWPEMLAFRRHLNSAVRRAGQFDKMKGVPRDYNSTKTNLLSRTAEKHTILETLGYETYDEYRNLRLHPAAADGAGAGGGSGVTTEGEDGSSVPMHRSEEFVVEVPEDERNFVDSTTDTIVLNTDTDHQSKIAFSYALSQSVKLDAIDHAVHPISSDLKRWQTKLASTGRILCSLTTLRKSKTHTMSLLEDLNFKQHIDTSPKIFWSGEYQHLRSVYKSACGHLEIGERGTALKTKLDTIDDSVTYLHHEVHASSNEFLTWVIIILIALELFQAMGMFADFEERIFGKEHDANRGWFRNRKPRATTEKDEVTSQSETKETAQDEKEEEGRRRRQRQPGVERWR